MTTFDQFFFNIFNYYKKRCPKKANSIAIFYITLLQSTVLLFVSVFFIVFLKQMKMSSMASDKVWMLFCVAAIGLYFKNWIAYSGKKRVALNAKKTGVKSKSYSIYLLLLLPLAILGLSVILLQA
ncbi:MAG: hypothetical protein HRT67_10260 [Flavobacteriaceae bacterium]|nr:hypothetical protein [Flavobacteriaceae bacterium]